MITQRSDSIIRTGGGALVVAALGFIVVFTYLAVRFNYPDVLDAPAATALPGLLAMGSTGRAVWAVYGLLPLWMIVFDSRRARKKRAVTAAPAVPMKMRLGISHPPPTLRGVRERGTKPRVELPVFHG